MRYALGFTGHRPNKLGGYSPLAVRRLDEFAFWWLGEWRRLNPQLDPVCIVGMAQGWDQAVARAAIALGIPFYACIPTDSPADQSAAWPTAAKAVHAELLNRAALVFTGPPFTASGETFAALLKRRNRTIVQHSNSLNALWDGTPGGTQHCVRHAQSEKIEVLNVWPEWEKFRNART